MPMNRKKVLRLARGYYGRAHSCIRVARMRVEKGLLHAYRGRKFKRRLLRGLFISRMNAASRDYGMAYADLVCGLRKSQIDLNRKMLANLTTNEPYSFKAVVDSVRSYALLTPRTYPQNGLLASTIVQKNRRPFLTSPKPIHFFS